MKDSIQTENEITVKSKIKVKEIEKILEENKYKLISDYQLEDYYYVPKDLDIKNMNVRDIIKETIMIRKFIGRIPHVVEYEFTKKIKNIDDKGIIISQKQVNCKIEDIEIGKLFLESINYKNILTIIEEGKLYEKEGLRINTKDINEDLQLIELEETEKYNIDKLKEILHKLNLPIDYSNLYVKKAEEELEKIIDCIS